MHPNPIFHTESAERNLAFARERAFGILAVNGAAGPMMALMPMQARIAVSGSDGYISPDWYGVPDQVPTWNYVAVHITGVVELRPQDEMRDLLDRQSKHFEDQLAPKPPWMTDKMTPDVLEKMMRQIVPCRMAIKGVDGTWKLNQNKPDAVRLQAADHVDAYGMGIETRLLAALMRGA